MEFFLQTFDIQLQAICPYTLATRFLEKEGSSPDIVDGLDPSNSQEEQ